MKHLGIVDVWHKETADWITPSTQVWAVRQFYDGGPINGLLFDYSYTSEENMRKGCWWFSKSDIRKNLKYQKMPFSEYLKQHLSELSGMNPFWSIGRADFLAEYNRKNNTFIW